MTQPLLPIPSELSPRLTASPLVILLDVDGTLAPIAPTPDAAAVPEATRLAISWLAGLPDVHVALVSGRGAADARRMVNVAEAWAIGNHGCETIAPDGRTTINPLIAPFETAMADAARTLEASVGQLPGVLVENKRWTLSIHVRQAAPGAAAGVREEVGRVADAAGLLVHDGKMVYEVRPPAQVDKGTAIVALAQELGARDGAAIFIGDDRTDEDGFRALRAWMPEAITVRVAPAAQGATDAEFSVPGTEDVRQFLSEIPGFRVGA